MLALLPAPKNQKGRTDPSENGIGHDLVYLATLAQSAKSHSKNAMPGPLSVTGARLIGTLFSCRKNNKSDKIGISGP